VILTTGLLTELARKHGPVDVLVVPNAYDVVESHPAVRDVLVYDKRRRDRGVGALLRIARRLANRRYARVYLPHRSLRSAALAWLARIPERIGFADGGFPVLYTRRVGRPKSGHEAERILALAGGRPATDANISLTLTDDDRAEAYAWLATRGIGDGFVAMAPGSVWGTKRWPGFADLARLLPGPIVVVGGPDESALARAIVDAAPDRVASAAGEVSLRVSAALIERAGVLVTNDSAPLHLASAVDTPTVAIFGPTVPAFGFGPRASKSAIVERTDLPCRPCSSHGPAKCPLGHHRCMREIPAETVRDVVRQLIG
jgi:heptosyltransferase-2